MGVRSGRHTPVVPAVRDLPGWVRRIQSTSAPQITERHAKRGWRYEAFPLGCFRRSDPQIIPQRLNRQCPVARRDTLASISTIRYHQPNCVGLNYRVCVECCRGIETTSVISVIRCGRMIP